MLRHANRRALSLRSNGRKKASREDWPAIDVVHDAVAASCKVNDAVRVVKPRCSASCQSDDAVQVVRAMMQCML